jgi:chromosome segregation ATPase
LPSWTEWSQAQLEEIERLTDDAKNRDAEIERLTRDVKERDSKIERLAGEVETATRVSGQARRRDRNARSTADERREEPQRGDRQAREQGQGAPYAEIERLTGDARDRKAEISQLTSEADSRNAEIERLTSDVAGCDAEIERLRQENGRLRAQAGRFATRLRREPNRVRAADDAGSPSRAAISSSSSSAAATSWSRATGRRRRLHTLLELPELSRASSSSPSWGTRPYRPDERSCVFVQRV